jgi:arginine utilization regulatory protein
LDKKKASFDFSQAHFEKIIDSIDEAIIGCDQDGYINFYNRANEKREKMNRQDVLNRHVEDVYDLHEHRSFLLQAMSTKKPILDRYQEYTVKDSTTTLEIFCSSVPIIDNGEVIGAVSVLKDYSKVRKLSNIIMDLHARIPGKKDRSQIASAKHRLEDIVGQDPMLQDTLKFAKKIANNRLPILIWGETGTGKELLAQGIHNASKYKNEPFIAINCAAIPENLLEGILFGTSKGAFTGAMDKPGLFEQASGGTLVLDEINSMDLTLQSKLLRVIQEETVRRIGDIKERKINTRLLSISNMDPMEAIQKGQMRKDLYYRIAYITMGLPPLRDRLEDLNLLVEHLIEKNNEKFALNAKGISSNFFELLNGYTWPGNIRELEHVIVSAMSHSQGQEQEILTVKALPENIKRKLLAGKGIKKKRAMKSMPLETIMNTVEKRVVQIALKRNKGHITNAARELGLKRQSLEYRIRKYSIEVKK